LERYQKCTDAEDVNRVQETIMEEGEKEWEERRKTKQEDGEDLLVKNPNHTCEDEEPPGSDTEEGDSTENSVSPQR
jgi:pre-rRNA-processing protein TSR3